MALCGLAIPLGMGAKVYTYKLSCGPAIPVKTGAFVKTF